MIYPLKSHADFANRLPHSKSLSQTAPKVTAPVYSINRISTNNCKNVGTCCKTPH